MRLFARVGGVLMGGALLAGCFSPLTTLPAPPDAWGAAGGAADCDSGLQLGSYCAPDSRSAVVLPDPAPEAERPHPGVDTLPTAPPASAPAWFPIAIPAALPTAAPPARPTAAPVALPTAVPTSAPVEVPLDEPTLVPIVIPAEPPAGVPTPQPTATPTPAPGDDGAWRPPGRDDEDKGWKGDRPKKDKDKGKGRKGD